MRVEDLLSRIESLKADTNLPYLLAGAGIAAAAAAGVFLRSKSVAQNDAAVVSALNLYPVKGLRGIPIQQAELDSLGLCQDRRWMLVELEDDGENDVDTSGPFSHQLGIFQSQRSNPRLATLSARIEFKASAATKRDVEEGVFGQLASTAGPASLPAPPRIADEVTALRLTVDRSVNTLGAPIALASTTVPLTRAASLLRPARGSPPPPPGACIRPVQVWRSTFQGIDQGDEVAEWLTTVLLSPTEQAQGCPVNPDGSPLSPPSAEAQASRGRGRRMVRLVYCDDRYSGCLRSLNSKWLPVTGVQGPLGRHSALSWLVSWTWPGALSTAGLPYPAVLAALTGGVSRATGFADGYPVLLASESSLSDLNERIVARGGAPVPMARFRPNVVIAAAAAATGPPLPPWAEEGWSKVQVTGGGGGGGTGVTLRGVKRCDRCLVTTTDPLTGARPTHTVGQDGVGEERGSPHAHEPLATLGTYRASVHGAEEGVFFAVNCVQELGLGWYVRAACAVLWAGLGLGSGVLPATGLHIRVGDRLSVLATGAMGPE